MVQVSQEAWAEAIPPDQWERTDWEERKQLEKDFKKHLEDSIARARREREIKRALQENRHGQEANITGQKRHEQEQQDYLDALAQDPEYSEEFQKMLMEQLLNISHQSEATGGTQQRGSSALGTQHGKEKPARGNARAGGANPNILIAVDVGDEIVLGNVIEEPDATNEGMLHQWHPPEFFRKSQEQGRLGFKWDQWKTLKPLWHDPKVNKYAWGHGRPKGKGMQRITTQYAASKVVIARLEVVRSELTADAMSTLEREVSKYMDNHKAAKMYRFFDEEDS